MGGKQSGSSTLRFERKLDLKGFVFPVMKFLSFDVLLLTAFSNTAIDRRKSSEAYEIKYFMDSFLKLKEAYKFV